MENCSITDYADKMMKKLYRGGMQRHFPKNEAQIYYGKFTLDVASYCFNNYESAELNNTEQACVEKLVKKNREFMDL